MLMRKKPTLSDSLVIIKSDCHGISTCNYHAVHLLHCIQTYKADEILKLVGLKHICCMESVDISSSIIMPNIIYYWCNKDQSKAIEMTWQQ